MLQIVIPEREFWDEIEEKFVSVKGESFQIEHSLVSIAKWEAKWCKPFLKEKNKTTEETIDYIRCMTITQNVRPEVYLYMPTETFEQIASYIEQPMTATWFNDEIGVGPKKKEIITAELIYYWMFSQNIPMECQKWHFNRLMTLIRVCNIKNGPPKKMGKKEAISQRNALNDMRRSQMNSKG